ncbi:hypothetical protein Cgig2_021775 [Carnegiea gigantea]|uniref:Uncharacterized protein n=1 Tax=Carnegiea gigantea TaxID=171969 RepID=A0A9Q1JJW4_9CARY|nr:hypothetical protein Cgig2_021775 [Carnegiea gigantea]
MNFEIRFGRGYLKDTLDKTTVTYEKEEANEEECHSKSVKAQAKVEKQKRVLKVKALLQDGEAATDSIIFNSRLLAKVMTELEELLPSARNLLKRVGKVTVELPTDVLIRDAPKKSKSRTLGLSSILLAFEIMYVTFHSSPHLISILGSLKRRNRPYRKDLCLLIRCLIFRL